MISDLLWAEVVVVTVDYILTSTAFVVCIVQKVLEIPMFVINGVKDILKDNV
tara:strand:+ start:400 stop:555 length:156 start_codon:yes stop_codon:yes gene_type:complete